MSEKRKERIKDAMYIYHFYCKILIYKVCIKRKR